MAYQGRQPGVGVRNRFIYSATGGQTSFSGADSNGLTLAYADATYVDVFLNGTLLVPVTDYAATTKTSVVLGSGAAASDIVEIVAYDISSMSSAVNKTGGTMTGDLSFGDNDKAIFGAGSDLQIYHDGSNSIIHDNGTGNLQIRAGNLNILNAAGTENYLSADNNGAVNLFYDNSKKIETTSTGVDVTGTVTSDGLTVDGNATLQNILNIGGTDPQIRTDTSDGSDNKTLWIGGGGVAYSWDRGGYLYAQGNEAGGHVGIAAGNVSGGSIKFTTSASEAMRIDSSGRVTKPYQPSFAASKSNGHLTSGTMIYNDVRHNVGSHYNSSNGRFTAPVTGRYFIGSMLMSHNDATYNNASYIIAKNGNTIQYVYSSSGSAVHHQWHWSGIISLSANDYVTIVYNNVKMYGESSGYSWFSGHLLG